MITCNYNYKGQNISKETLYNLLTEAASSDVSIEEVLFSRANKQLTRGKILEEIKYTGIIDRKGNSLLDGDISFTGNKGEFSISSFLDSPYSLIDGNAPYQQRNLDDYRNEELEILLREGYSVKDANKRIDKTIESWDKIAEDSRILHQLCVDYSIGHHSKEWDTQRQKFVEKALTIIKADSPFRNVELLKSLYDQFAVFYRDNKGIEADSIAYRNIGLTAKLRNIDAKIFGHIDYAFIDTSGTLHVYNFKVTTQNPGSWVKAKEQKFKLEGAFIKQLLIANGIQVNNIGEIEYNIVPIRLYYNEDFTKINKATILPVKRYDYDKNRYKARNEDNIARRFVEIPFEINVDEKELNESDKIFEYSFPFMKVSSERIYKSTLQWIKEAPTVGETESLVIKEVNEKDCRYRVILYGKTYDIKDFTLKENNQEIISLVKKHLDKLNAELGNYSAKISNAVDRSFKHKIPFVEDLQNSSFISGVLSKYLPINKDTESDWILNKDLIEYNILLFKNRNTNQVDVVSISSEDLEQMGDFRKGAKNILGSYKLDGNKDASTLKGDMGNVELVRTMILLNQLFKSSNFLESSKLGEIVVLSSSRNGQSRRHHIKEFNDNYFKHFIKIIKQENGDKLESLKNNFSSAQYVDMFDDIVSTYQSLVEGLSDAQRHIFEEMGFDNLQELEKTGKVGGLFELLTQLSNSYQLKDKTPEDIYNIAHPREGVTPPLLEQIAAKLYELISRAYAQYTGQVVQYGNNLGSIDINSFTAPTIPDVNVRMVVNNMQTTLDSIAFEENKEYETYISPIIQEYYKACGYSNIQNMVIGNQLHLFDNLYEDSENLIFKNPYDENNDLKPHERTFLKKSLFYINKVRFKDKQKFSSYNDPNIPKFINNDKTGQQYLWVPLVRASNTSQRQQGLSERVQRIKRGFRIISKSKDWFTEVVSKMTKDERELMDQGISSLSLRNPFSIGENPKRRQNYINENGKGFFETNLENIMVEYMSKSIEVEKLNKFLVGTKSILLQLHIMGNDSDEAKNIINKESKLIKEYITQNVFNTSTMDEGNQKVVAALTGLKTKVTYANLAGNIIAFFRDISNGFMENYLRSVTHFQTDIKREYLTKAYEYVLVNGRSDAMNINLLSKLNIRYRLSNTDLARIKERLRTNRNGIYNWDNWAFASLRSPDFLNRMTLFVARCMQDGVWDAYSYENGELKYDVKKDMRFQHFLHDDRDHPDYSKEKALFILHVNNWNKEHPDKYLDWSKKELPEPYSDQEILAIKNVSNNIYGSYDKSLKSQYEHTAIGWVFGMYTTWMNGIWNNWAMKPGKYNIHNMETKIQQDEDGNNIYMLDNGIFVTEHIDESGNRTYVDDEGNMYNSSDVTPVLEQVPVIVQGIWYTLCDVFRVCRDGFKEGRNGIVDAYKYINGNEVDKRNILHGAYSSLIALLFLILFKTALDPIYNDSKKKSSGMNLAERLAVSVTYKSLNGARDSFAGPLNIFEYFGEQMDPPIYKVPIKLIKDSGKWLFGDKTFLSLVSGNIAVARGYKDVITFYEKSK